MLTSHCASPRLSSRLRLFSYGLPFLAGALVSLHAGDALADRPFGNDGSAAVDESESSPSEPKHDDDFRSAGTDGRKRDYEAPRRWYGYQTLSVDAASIGLVTLGVVADGNGAQTGLLMTGGLSYLLTAPIIHFAHGHPGKGAGDFGLRVGAPVVLGTIGMVIALSTYKPTPASEQNAFSNLADSLERLQLIAVGGGIGALVGASAAIAIDGAVIAREDVPREKNGADSAKASPPPPAPRSHVSFVPQLGPIPGGASAGVAGIF